MGKQVVQTGLDVLENAGFAALGDAHIGIIANQASVNSRLEHLVDVVRKRSRAKLVRLFAPEHGFGGALQDMAEVDTGLDPKSNLQIVSLYGKTEESLAPTKEQLEDIDILLVDLPDIGTRYYTFAQTLAFSMQMAAQTNTSVIVLDRPNPIGGTQFEGAELRKDCRSFCGYAPVANRHGLTLGELANLMRDGFGDRDNGVPPIECELDVIPVGGWSRSMYFQETGLPWVYPSPNMPTVDTAIVYPGTCLFEATNLSEGRGTTRPFELLGAPFIDGQTWAEETLKMAIDKEIGLGGAVLRPVQFQPQFQKWAGKVCGGLQLHVVDRRTFKPFRWGLALILAAAKLYPDEFAWRKDAYEFVKEVPAIDLLFGSPLFRKLVDTEGELGEIIGEIEQFENFFGERREAYLLY